MIAFLSYMYVASVFRLHSQSWHRPLFAICRDKDWRKSRSMCDFSLNDGRVLGESTSAHISTAASDGLTPKIHLSM